MTNKKPLEWWVFLGVGWFIHIVYGKYLIVDIIGSALVTYGMVLGILILIKKLKVKK